MRRRRRARAHARAAACACALGALGALANDVTERSDVMALIVSASAFWFNYRHAANALSVYRAVTSLGVRNENIVLMLASDAACDSRNGVPGAVYNDVNRVKELYGADVEVDYRGSEVTPESVIRALTNRHERGTPRRKKLLSTKTTNVLVYITGHGGDGFIKFQDSKELRAREIAEAFAQMYAKNRYREVLFIAETCQAATLAKAIASPRILALSSSAIGENSYSHHSDPDLGVHVIDRFTYHTLEFFENVDVESEKTVDEYVRSLTRDKLQSTAVLDAKTFTHRAVNTLKLTDFFSGVSKTKVLADPFDWFVGEMKVNDGDLTSTETPRELNGPR